MTDTKAPERIWVEFDPRDWPTERIMYGDMQQPYEPYVHVDLLTTAEAERDRWRQAAAKGSIHTQADLDRAVAEARAEAYLSGWVNGSNGVEPPDFGNPVFEKTPGDEAEVRAQGET